MSVQSATNIVRQTIEHALLLLCLCPWTSQQCGSVRALARVKDFIFVSLPTSFGQSGRQGQKWFHHLQSNPMNTIITKAILVTNECMCMCMSLPPLPPPRRAISKIWSSVSVPCPCPCPFTLPCPSSINRCV